MKKLYRKFTTIFLLLFYGLAGNTIYSQSLQWTKTYGGAGQDGAQSLVLTPDGGIVIAAFQTLSNGDNTVLMKTDRDGNVLWSRAYGNDLIFLGGDMKGTFDGGFILTGRTLGESAFLLKTDSAGNELWREEYDYPIGIDNRGHSVWQTSDSGYVVAGQTWIIHGQFGNYDMFVFKTDKNGNAEWMKIYYREEEDADVALAVQQLPNRGYIIGGFTQSSKWACYVLRIDDLGNVVWSNIYPGPWQSECYDIQQTPDLGFIMTGTETSFVTDSDFLLAKLDSSGNVVWKKIYSTNDAEYGTSIQQLSEGYLVCGQSSHGAGSWDMYVVRTSSFGDTLWTRLIGGESDDRGFDAQKTIGENIYAAGWTWSFGAGSGDIYLAKITDNVFGISGNNETSQSFELKQNYPNPFNPSTYIRFNIPAGLNENHVKLEIFNSAGQSVETLVNSQLQPGSYELLWDASVYPSGVYFYTLRAGDFFQTKKMVLLK